MISMRLSCLLYRYQLIKTNIKDDILEFQENSEFEFVVDQVEYESVDKDQLVEVGKENDAEYNP